MVFVQLLHGLTFGAHHASSIAAVKAWFPGVLSRGQTHTQVFHLAGGSLIGWGDQWLDVGLVRTGLDIYLERFVCIGWISACFVWVGKNATVDG